jgi:hypothetical protein
MTSVCSPFRSLPPLCLNVLRATRLVPVIGGGSARSGCQMGRGACGSDTSHGRCGPKRMPSQANSVGHDRVLRSTADSVACSRDAAAERFRHGRQPIYHAVPQPRRVVVSIYEIAAGATLREHKHPFVRYAYVLTGGFASPTCRLATATSIRPEALSSKDWTVASSG